MIPFVIVSLVAAFTPAVSFAFKFCLPSETDKKCTEYSCDEKTSMKEDTCIVTPSKGDKVNCTKTSKDVKYIVIEDVCANNISDVFETHISNGDNGRHTETEYQNFINPENVDESPLELVGVSQKKEWLEGAFSKKVEKSVSSISRESTAVKVEWLKREVDVNKHKKDQSFKTPKINNEPVDSVLKGKIHEKKKWLEATFNRKEEKECSKTPISQELTTERHRWLEEEKTETILEKETLLEPISRDQTAVKALSIVDQLNKKEEKQLPNISRELTSEKACWLEKDAFKKEPLRGDIIKLSSKDQIYDSARLITENSNESGNRNTSQTSQTLTSQRVKRLEEEGQNKTKVRRDPLESVSRDTVASKMKWLQSEAFKSKVRSDEEALLRTAQFSVNEELDGYQLSQNNGLKNVKGRKRSKPKRMSGADRMKELQSQAFKSK